jgi:hypothetical protein
MFVDELPRFMEGTLALLFVNTDVANALRNQHSNSQDSSHLLLCAWALSIILLKARSPSRTPDKSRKYRPCREGFGHAIKI